MQTDRQTTLLEQSTESALLESQSKYIKNTGGAARKVSFQGKLGWSSPSSLYLTS